MKRTAMIGLGLALTSAAAIGFATPANASGTVLAGTYSFPEGCNYQLQAGLNSHTFVAGYCLTIIEAEHYTGGPYAPSPGEYQLWVQYN